MMLAPRFSIRAWLHNPTPYRPLILQHDPGYPELSRIWIYFGRQELAFFIRAEGCHSLLQAEASSRLVDVPMADRTRSEIAPNTLLRLADTVKIAFPMGGMTVAGLRRERDRNRLVVEKIAGQGIRNAGSH